MAERWDEHERGYRRDDGEYRNRPFGERDKVDRAGDEVRSWFGDDDAARRRRMDEARENRGERFSSAVGRTWDRTREAARDVTDWDRDGRRGLAEWNDNDRPGQARPSSYSTADRNRNDDYWSRDREYRDASYRPSGAYPESRDPSSTSLRYGTSYGPGAGAYAGRGPRGYTRGDERIREDLCDRLTDDSRIDASDIDVQVKGGEVTLSGSVRTRDEKRFSEDLAERISGVRDVNNNLKVKSADDVLGTARSGSSVLGLTDNPPPPPTKTK
jgi:osmotically-inducible protein OsmY